MKLKRGRRLPRHLQALYKHATGEKLANLIRVEVDLRRGNANTLGFPYIVFMDICNACNLRCPLCPTVGEQFKQPRKTMNYDFFKKAFAQVERYAVEINLHNWGEPLLNPDVFKIIDYAQAHNVGTNLSTNFSSIGRAQIDLMLETGLEYLVVSLDGLDAETYRHYRVGGQFEVVFDNLNYLMERKRKLKKNTPRVEWQFLVMKHNEHQINAAASKAEEIGVDLIRFSPVGLPFERFSDKGLADKWLPVDPEYLDLDPRILENKPCLFDKPCHYLYRSISINPNGSIAPCCVVYDSAYDFGDLRHSDLEDIWTGEKYVTARRLFGREINKLASDDLQGIPCVKCRIFRSSTTFRKENQNE